MSITRYQLPPKLPVPSQKDCFKSYLDDLSAIVSPEEWQRTKELTDKFLEDGGLGQQLHERLVEFAGKADNWAHDFWLEDMYFRMGLPLPVNSNPGMVLPKEHFSSESEWLRFVAEVARGIVEYKLLIDDEAIAQQYTRNNEPQCMKQYNNMFLTYRRPGVIQDERLRFARSEHCVVVVKGQFFQMAVFQDGKIRSLDSLTKELQWILKKSGNNPQLPVGLLTTLDRRRWGKTNKMLAQDPTNRKSLDAIESSLFVVCLDEACQMMSDIDVNEETTTLHEMIHGGGSTAHSRNRWFEKPIQLIVNRDGYCGLNYEHSTAEGIPVVACIEYSLKKASRKGKQSASRPEVFGSTLLLNWIRILSDLITFLIFPNSSRFLSLTQTRTTWRNGFSGSANGEKHNGHSDSENGCDSDGSLSPDSPYPPKHLQWCLSSELLDILDTTCVEIDQLAGDLELRVYRFEPFGKNIPKQYKMSPDCFVQLALQLAYYKSHGHLVATYESASIRRFNYGRVDVIRAATKEALAWVEAMTLNGRSKEEMLKLFRDAMAKQTDVMNKAIRGQGVDNYFIALREIGVQTTGRVPEVFEDDNFKYFNNFMLSTSQVPTSDEHTFMGYGPVVKGGYGCSYNLHERQILFCISSWRSCSKTRTIMFARNLNEGLMEMRNLLEETCNL